jgi:hypothetical protein
MLEYLGSNLVKEGYAHELYGLHYQTRPESNEFLGQKEPNHSMPDLYYMSEAYTTIKEWFESGKYGIARQMKVNAFRMRYYTRHKIGHASYVAKFGNHRHPVRKKEYPGHTLSSITDSNHM